MPIVLLSVPNQITPVARSNTMWRIVPPPLLTSVAPSICGVAGSKPASQFGCFPVSTHQLRSCASTVFAYGSDDLPSGDAHSFHCLVRGSYATSIPRM